MKSAGGSRLFSAVGVDLGEQVFGSTMQQTILCLSLALPSLVRSFSHRRSGPTSTDKEEKGRGEICECYDSCKKQKVEPTLSVCITKTEKAESEAQRG